MVRYLSDLMEDATDFSWLSAKVAHAILLLPYSYVTWRGILHWGDTEKIDRIRRAHAKKHSYVNQNWVKSSLDSKKPWFCKQYQTNSCSFSKDHGSFGICANCLASEKILSHPECECRFAKKSQPKNGQVAAQN